jgi:hypothetical protein
MDCVGGRVVCRLGVNSQPAQSELPEVALTQFLSPDDEHDVLETCRIKNKNKYIERNLCVTLVQEETTLFSSMI